VKFRPSCGDPLSSVDASSGRGIGTTDFKQIFYGRGGASRLPNSLPRTAHHREREQRGERGWTECLALSWENDRLSLVVETSLLFCNRFRVKNMARQGRGPTSTWELPRLAANAPDPKHRESLMLFGQFVGDWQILECRVLTAPGSWRELVGELHWRWVLRGRAVQDVWTLFDKSTGKLFYEGTTIRLYVPETGTWASTWISTSRPRARSFVGRSIGNEIVLDEIVEDAAHQERWVFFDITPNAFRWRGEERPNDDSSWKVTEQMRIQRVA